MEICVYGAGCPKCKELEKRVINALAELDVAAAVSHQTDLNTIVDAGFFMTPGLTINGTKVAEGKVPSPTQIKVLIQQYLD